MGSVASTAKVDDRTLIEEKVAELTLPRGVTFAGIEPSQSWTGEPMWLIRFNVSKRIPLTRKYVRELATMDMALTRSLFDAEIEGWPTVKLLEVK